ncbi:formyltetrahydrofolate deformylase [Colletotrichum orchidophilum]|uniref:Formyltetrahydrofolate deformylase n=1 Tax=Colletotrichum orchidophilum TaxID=1209926 RepID=A0A1G4AXU5_9PEZI|nr:formyltetrahydrofolate deformylase [Colletotrichum orchidophilum]OHE93935.1 formyltetrahydrofolate deformylase [Colletotrichum orchidophilum]
MFESNETCTFNIAPASHGHILTLSCLDKSGIVRALTGFFAAAKLNVLDLQQVSDLVSEKFLVRVHFGPTETESTEHLKGPLDALAADVQLDWYRIRPVTRKLRTLILVSKIGHCLNDLLFRANSGQLPIDIPLIVSNHNEYQGTAGNYGIDSHHLPVNKDTEDEREEAILRLVKENDTKLVVLASYMQVLTSQLCAAMSGKIINIHHPFLPSFKGAKPYHQAYERGVKIIGSTSHIVTADLDEGPIIEQRVARIDHCMSPRMWSRKDSTFRASSGRYGRVDCRGACVPQQD